MRTRPLPIAALAIACAANGQVAYDFPDAVPPMGTYWIDFHQSTGAVGTIPDAPPWDLSGIVMDAGTPSTYQWLPASASPDAGSFPTATHLLSDNFNDMDEFMLLEADGVTLLGGVYSSMPASVLIDPFRFRVFPSMVGATYTDTLIAPPADTSVWNHEPTGLGTLITAWGTFTDVVRVERTRTIGTTTYPDHVFWYSTTNLLEPLAYLSVNWDVLVILHPTGFTGIGERDDEHALKAYPNPTRDQVIIVWNGEQPRSIALRDATGRCVIERPWMNGTRQVIDLPTELAPGDYHLSLTTDRMVIQRPLVVVR